jgi:hypothetical protein
MSGKNDSQNRKRFRKSLNTLNYCPAFPAAFESVLGVPEPVLTPGADTSIGEHARFIREA